MGGWRDTVFLQLPDAARRWACGCAPLIGRTRISQRERRSRSPFVFTAAPIHNPVNTAVLRPSAPAWRWCYLKTRVMDATIYQIIFGELGDINCSLMDAFQDTFLENTSLSLLSTDGKVEVFLPSFPFFCLNTSWMRRMNVFFSPSRFLLQCHNRRDWNLLAEEQRWEDHRETLPGVHQRGEVQHNE